MPYPENFAVRLLVCIAGMFVIWIGVSYLMSTFIWHEPFTFSVVRHVVLPILFGVAEALSWKPKQKD